MDRKNIPVRQRSSTFHAMTYVWGRDDLEVLFTVCLARQLAPGNMSALPEGSRYRILTQPVHQAEIDAHPHVRTLRGILPVDIVPIEASHKRFAAPGSYELMNACQRQALRDAFAAGAAMLFLPANFVFSDGAISTVIRRHREGHRAVVATSLRVNRETFLQRFGEPVGRATLSPRELVAMALPHLHADTLTMFADARPFSAFPLAVYWRVGDEGVVARALDLHPLMVDPVHPLLPGGTIDGRYLRDTVRVHALVHVVTDSDELQMFELIEKDRRAPSARGAGASVWRSAVVVQECSDLQRAFWRNHPITLHAGVVGEAQWLAAKNASEAYVSRVTRLSRHSKTITAFSKWPKMYWLFCKRRDQYITQARRMVRQLARPVERSRKEVSRAARILQKRVRKSKLLHFR